VKLTLLCVTQAKNYVWPFLRHMETVADQLHAQLVIAGDGDDAIQTLIEGSVAGRFVGVRSRGYLESVLDAALEQCDGEYVLRLDDDERCSPAMVTWLESDAYLIGTHWKFPRMHLWPDTQHYIVEPQLWPDEQTRLSVREKAGGRRTIHAGSPFGGGALAPVAIEHHKFLVRTRAEREDTARRWHNGNMIAFSLPEDVFVNPRLEDVPC
jgi:hypothetical protein